MVAPYMKCDLQDLGFRHWLQYSYMGKFGCISRGFAGLDLLYSLSRDAGVHRTESAIGSVSAGEAND